MNKKEVVSVDVVNKKWARVALTPGSSAGRVSLPSATETHQRHFNLLFFLSSAQSSVWFNIGSVDSFERNLENIQLDMDIEQNKHIPVIYRTEMEMSNVMAFLPTILTVGLVLFMLQKSKSALGFGGKGGGLFGGVTSSTAKMIDPDLIGVQFKWVWLLLWNRLEADSIFVFWFHTETLPVVKKRKSKSWSL